MLVDKDRSPADPTRVALEEEWEVRWWYTKFGCTEVQLRSAIKRAGTTAVDVERELKKHGKEILKNMGED
jgi:hypothetical protein